MTNARAVHKAEHGGGEREYVTDGVSSCVEGEILLISAGYGLKTQKTTNHEPRGSFVRGLACFNQQNTYGQKNRMPLNTFKTILARFLRQTLVDH